MDNLDKYYKTREEKPIWVINNFPTLFESSKRILDIGCDKKQLSQYLKADQSYVGMDVSEEADIQHNLDGGSIPVDDKSFDLVIALDVLEHLEDIHFVFDELCRVSSEYLLISLPNNLQAVIGGYVLGKNNAKKQGPAYRLQHGKYTKFYGLPFNKPEDRHRWLFNADEAEEFIKFIAESNGFRVEKLIYEIDMQPFFKKILLFIICGFSRRRMLNFFSGTIFMSLKKHEIHN